MKVLNLVGIIKLRPLRELDAKGELVAPGMDAEGEDEATVDAAAE